MYHSVPLTPKVGVRMLYETGLVVSDSNLIIRHFIQFTTNLLLKVNPPTPSNALTSPTPSHLEYFFSYHPQLFTLWWNKPKLNPFFCLFCYIIRLTTDFCYFLFFLYIIEKEEKVNSSSNTWHYINSKLNIKITFKKLVRSIRLSSPPYHLQIYWWPLYH